MGDTSGAQFKTFADFDLSSLPLLYSLQQTILNDPARYKVLAGGRRVGKSTLGSQLCVRCAVVGGQAWWVAPSYPIAAIGWKMIKRLCRNLPERIVRETDRSITMPNDGFVQVKSAHDPDSLRGVGLDLVVLDEAAYMHEEAWTEALRPTLSD